MFCHVHVYFFLSFVCSHSRRTFIYVSQGDINRSRQDRTSVKTLPGTRQIHAVRGVSPFRILSRRFTCFCESCLGDEEGNCLNRQLIQGWSQRKLKVTGRRESAHVQGMCIFCVILLHVNDEHETPQVLPLKLNCS